MFHCESHNNSNAVINMVFTVTRNKVTRCTVDIEQKIYIVNARMAAFPVLLVAITIPRSHQRVATLPFIASSVKLRPQ